LTSIARPAARAIVVFGLLATTACRPSAPDVSADVMAMMSGGDDDAGFARVTAPEPLAFPAAEGPHPAYRTEWWYYTGNLRATEPRASGRRFGFQLTFFRSALAPSADVGARDSAWGTNQAYLAHFALTDVGAGAFHSAERLARGAAGLAGATADPFRAWLETWSASRDGGPVAPVRLVAADGPVAIDLSLRPAKPPVGHGDAGYSVKGPEPGNASMYFSYSRLAAAGTVATADGTFAVEGGAWHDHEWSTSALSEGQVGWDWLSLQLDDGRDLMVFRIREADGGIAPTSSGTLIAVDGTARHLAVDDFTLEPRGRWTSPRTGGAYPASWRVAVPGGGLELEVVPLLADQELSTAFRYWEGAVEVKGAADGEPIAGEGYLEMTGYAPTGEGRR